MAHSSLFSKTYLSFLMATRQTNMCLLFLLLEIPLSFVGLLDFKIINGMKHQRLGLSIMQECQLGMILSMTTQSQQIRDNTMDMSLRYVESPNQVKSLLRRFQISLRWMRAKSSPANHLKNQRRLQANRCMPVASSQSYKVQKYHNHRVQI